VTGQAVPSFSSEQRRARMAVRHALAPGHRAPDPVDVADRVLALHATDPATVHLSVLIRTDAGGVARTEDALYEKRSLLRLLGMRRSMFVVPLDVAPVIQAACSRAVAAAQRRLLVKDIVKAGAGGTDPDGWLAALEDETLAALRHRGTATATQLAGDVPGLKTQLTYAEGKSYGGTGNITSRVMFLLGADARIVRGRPRGTWISSQYVWSPMDAWLDGGLPVLDTDAARAELIRRWLVAFGPAPVSDIQWWTGLGKRDVQKALGALDAIECDLGDGGLGVVLSDDLEIEDAVEPWAGLLPGLDPTAMGWQRREWYLGEHASRLTDRTGNIGPTVWWDGRAVGGWAQRKDGEIVWRLLDDIGAEGEAAVAAAAAELAQRVGDARWGPKFPAPLNRELLA